MTAFRIHWILARTRLVLTKLPIRLLMLKWERWLDLGRDKPFSMGFYFMRSIDRYLSHIVVGASCVLIFLASLLSACSVIAAPVLFTPPAGRNSVLSLKEQVKEPTITTSVNSLAQQILPERTATKANTVYKPTVDVDKVMSSRQYKKTCIP